MRRPGGVEAEEGDPSFPEVFVGATPSSTSGFEKRTPAGVSSPGALSYRTSQTSRTGRTARMTLGVYLGEIPPHADPAGGCVLGWGSAGGER